MQDRPSPLANRVRCDGAILADPARGLLTGNRGGRLHDARYTIVRRQASRRWICCALSFKDRQRQVMGAGYTELFFLDEVVALSAGHRPCFECRRPAALAFSAALGGLRADAIDRRLSQQRGIARRMQAEALPDGAVVRVGDADLALCGDNALPLALSGYGDATPRPSGPVAVLTPATTLQALCNGYRPIWHESAGLTRA